MKFGRVIHSSGFTLIELMVTLAMLAILSALAAPSYRQLMASQTMKAASFDILNDLALARNEALKRGENVSIAPAGGGWAAGWTVKVVSSSKVLSQRNPVGGGISFTVSPSTLIFDNTGRISGSTAVVRFGLSDGGSNNRCISLDPAGRTKRAATACPT